MDGYIVSLAGESCSLEQLISRCFGIDDLGQYGINWLKNNFLGDILADRKVYINLERNSVKTNPRANYIDEKELDSYRYYHPYMFRRKMTPEVIEIFDIGYDRKTDCITFPIRDKYGNCLFIARRSVTTKYFNYPNNIEKPVYGIYELYRFKKFPKEIYICESMIDAITLWTHKKYAVALNGLGTRYQFEQLRELPCRKFILALDNDAAGYKGRTRIRDNIRNKLITDIILPTNRKDINECEWNEIENLKEIF